MRDEEIITIIDTIIHHLVGLQDSERHSPYNAMAIRSLEDAREALRILSGGPRR